MDDQRDYAEEAANRAELVEEGMSELAEECTQAFIKVSRGYSGEPYEHSVRNGIFEMDIEFPDIYRASSFAYTMTYVMGELGPLHQLYANIALRDTVESLDNPVVLTITKKL